MPTSRECEECEEVRHCRMYLDRDDRIVYLCVRCARGWVPRTALPAHLTD